MPPRCICFMFCQSPFSGLIGILVQAQAPILWGFLDAWTKFLSTVRDWIGSIVGTLIFKVNISPNIHFGLPPPVSKRVLGENNKRGGFGRSGGGVCLVGNTFLEVGGVFLSYLEAPRRHI